MPIYRAGAAWVHVGLSGKARQNPPAPCVAQITIEGKPQSCCAISTALCDWRDSEGRTCDAPLCPEHALEIDHNKHLCPRHTRVALLHVKHGITGDLFAELGIGKDAGT